MDPTTRTHLANLRSEDGDTRYAAYLAVLAATEQPVDWAYEAWDDLVKDLQHPHNHIRTIAAQVLSNLAKSDPKGRIFKDYDKIVLVTHDPKFVTARHTLQAMWKVGAVSQKHQKLVLDRLSKRYADAVKDRNTTLIRYDIIDDLRKLYDVTPDEKIKSTALALIETELDPKYRKKYSTRWKNA
jgi:hypothetical protein